MAQLLLCITVLASLYCCSQADSYIPPSYVPSPRWSNWSPWSSCSNCYQKRTRQCLTGSNCPGKSLETRNCCPTCKPAYWAGWSRWAVSSCSPRCLQSRSRKCIVDNRCRNPADKRCPGISQQTQSCSRKVAKKAKQWTSWSQWSACNKDCKKTRTRRCKRCDGKYTSGCPGNSRQEMSCSKSDYWGQWGPWGTCQGSCGAGKRYRKRTCMSCKNTNQCSGASTQSEVCRNAPCCNPSWGGWSGWGQCNQRQSCKRTRTRSCNNSCPGRSCSGASSEHKSCAVWGEWGGYGACIGCRSAGKKVRSRQCNAPSYCSKDCYGSGTMSTSCYGYNCGYGK